MASSSSRPAEKTSALSLSTMCICTPWQSCPSCLWNVGQKLVRRKWMPGVSMAAMRRSSSPSSRNGAPMTWKGIVVPRPSLTLVPSKMQVPI